MKLSNFATSLLLALGLAFTAQAQWIKLPLPGTPRTKDGKPNLSAPAPRASDGHPDLSGIWISKRQYTNPKGRGLERFMPAGSKVPLLPAAENFNLFNNVRRQTLNPSVTYKMKGPQLSDGYSIFNSPEQLRANLKASNRNTSELDLYNQYRQGFGSTNITTVLDPRRIEVGMRFKF
jgi:hypothetical protein